ncbi:non-canonical purine NTP pyrophosphatase [Pseudomonas atacamensis]|uniref:non-canonical purine NTP pyrophosphatase n=1 Tax=Pseudomonas atacamensis TaxID=2565368 RepID=UPI002480FF00|nr:non-canonical purine NTP pyrophosphatase [Pseudomonas atacamensis]WGT34693.1 non-canonical purine NTP pyrophosphatase [Pseudomonas atacamensis]
MIRLIFLSSNLTKIAHFEYLLREQPILLLPPPNYGKPYYEPRIEDREKLLEESILSANLKLAKNLNSIDQAIQSGIFTNNGIEDTALLERYASMHQNKLFFIEDTSIAIEALSTEGEFPGVNVKYWMRETSFSQLDEQLKAHGNNRRVTVRSDIVLYLPPNLRSNPSETYKVFVGKTQGTIVEKEEPFETNKIYPWLDNKTFNKWFVPKGARKPISRLQVNTALRYDFRNLALQQLIEFLKSKDLVDDRKYQDKPLQGELFPRRNYIICGSTCAGKTVLASALTRLHAYRHIEASDFMRCALYTRHGYSSNMKTQDFAKNALETDPGIVARQISEYIKDTPKTGLVITGFRSPKEIEILQEELSEIELEVLFIESSLETRYQRNIKRNRSDAPISFSEFEGKNEIQNAMGLSAIASEAKVIANESSLTTYIRSAVTSLTNEAQLIPFVCDISTTTYFLPLEQAILVSMLIDHKNGVLPLTTTQIAKNMKDNLRNLRRKGNKTHPVDKNNVSRFFNQRFSPHFEAHAKNEKIHFSLSHTGISAAIALIRKIMSDNA